MVFIDMGGGPDLLGAKQLMQQGDGEEAGTGDAGDGDESRQREKPLPFERSVELGQRRDRLGLVDDADSGLEGNVEMAGQRHQCAIPVQFLVVDQFLRGIGAVEQQVVAGEFADLGAEGRDVFVAAFDC